MIDQAKVTSGFDVEFLMSEEYIRYFLLCSMDTGSIPWWSESEGKDENGKLFHRATITHPPSELKQRRLYPVYPDFVDNEHPFQNIVPTVYSNREDEFKVTILPDDATGADILLRVFPSVIDLLPQPPVILIENLLPADLHISFDIVFDPRQDGLLSNIGVQIELLDVSGLLIDIAIEKGATKASILEDMKAQIDRRVPFAVAGGGSLQRIETRKFLDDAIGPKAIGVYINLALQSSPDPASLLPDRGDINFAQNFLEPGAKMAFAFPPETYARLGDDFKFKMAVPKPNKPGEFHYPLMDGDDRVGIIKGISVRPEFNGDLFTNVLVIDIHGEYAVENFFDPDFHMKIRLVPTVKEYGVFDFDVDFDLDLSLAAHLVAIFLTTALSFVMPKLGLSLLFLSILTLKIIERVGESLAQSSIQAQLDRTSFLDTLPHRLTVEIRRWDPLYSTLHLVQTADVEIQVNGHGFAFDAKNVFIDRRFQPLQNMVIRTETRDASNAVSGLVYRANDIGGLLNNINNDLVKVYPATDRMPYVEILLPQGDIESHRISLSLDQVQARIAAEDRHMKELDYIPKKVEVIGNQIFQILAISKTEISEIENLTRDRLRNEIRNSNGPAFRQQAIDELQAELGRAPTEEEIIARFDQILENAVNTAFRGRLQTELDNRMKFDLEPHEFADLQHKKILVLGRGHLVIRRMFKNDPKVTVYYRDYESPFEPNTEQSDNLLSLPRYKHAGD